MLRQSGDRARAIRWLAIDAAAPLVGAIVGAVALDLRGAASARLLAVYAGFFLFMGATDLLPHAHEHPSAKRVALTLVGFGAIFLVSLVGQLRLARRACGRTRGSASRASSSGPSGSSSP